ncbi:MAG: peptide transporter ATP-binding protein [Glaciihabitans sp.]|nr:peptide transporter ATP-binding protein [Glaciihabitans sp.]
MNNAVLSLSGITVSLAQDRSTQLVENVSLDVERGQVVCLVGESGSGKSVLARTMMGLTQLDRGVVVEGDVLWDGIPLGRRSHEKLRGRDLSMVFQEPVGSLDPLFTVESQLSEALRRAHGRIGLSETRRRIRELLSEVGIPDPDRVMRSYAHQLSGGMCQRVMIAGALACEPKLLIADEPTTALDVTVQAQILDLIARLCKERDMAVILVTHDLGVAARLADRVAVLYSGQLVEDAGSDKTFTSARHPYTRGLLDCVPLMTGPRRTLLTTVEGSVPDPTNRPSGCPFSPRCARATSKCEEMPAMNQEPERRFACWNPYPEPADIAGSLV